ncbi:hypothetical protein QBC46DRAFT_352001 [Diplogelasinospora grovesii]|uniref:FAD/NAD(P)-binding domain-containing protein n=1 Tax=Diplogelasinospora grovesii TaxID=303347 RepID=A0AAN6NBU8_9PEZI|nr:hypothetical protein QBC46DRAFT_352001 [Diplogelasinospora grovesii]
MPKEIIILGGSYAGLSTAHYLLKHILPSLPTSDCQIVLVSPSEEVFCRPACPRALISDDMFPQDKLFVSIPASFSQYPEDRFRFVQGTAVSLDHVKRTVDITIHPSNPNLNPEMLVVTYEALVIATGASTPSPLLGFTPNNTHTDPATVLRQNWSSFRTQLHTYTAKSIIIAGGGPAGVEVAGELGEHLNGPPSWVSWLRPAQRSPKVPITLLTAGDRILPALRPTIAKTAEGYLARVGVSVVKNARVVSVTQVQGGNTTDKDGTAEGGQSVAVVLEDGRVLSGDIYIPCTGTRPNTAFIRDELLTGDGRVDTNPQTLRVEKGGVVRVYAIGDASNYARPAVHNILSAVPVLCANMKLDLLKVSGGAEQEADGRVFKEDISETQLVPIGRSKGVGAAMGYRLPSWLIWAIKGRDYWLWTTGGLWSGKKWDRP